MGNKLFIFLVVVLSILIIISLVAFIGSFMKYNGLLQTGAERIDEDEIVNQVENDSNVSIDDINTYEETNEVVEDTSSKKAYILPSDTREITANDLKDMDKEELNRAYNEIFARHGHDFKTKSLKDFFEEQDWYNPIEGKTVTPAELSDLENKNKDIIMSRIRELE